MENKLLITVLVAEGCCCDIPSDEVGAFDWDAENGKNF
jgi:hypothetical protein